MAAQKIPADANGVARGAGGAAAGVRNSPAGTGGAAVSHAPGESPPAVRCDVRPPAAGDGRLSACTNAAYGAVLQVLDGDAPESGYMAIARLSSHLAAMMRTVYPSTGGRHGSDGGLLGTWRARARDVEWALRLLECRLAGDMFAAPLPADAVYQRLRHCLGSYRAAERALVAWAEEQLSPGECERLAGDYRAVLTRAPTRPHPHGPHTGPLARLAFGVHSAWDRVLDGMDCRPGVGSQFPVPSGQRAAGSPGSGPGG